MAKRILAVEDDPDILFIVEYILQEQGYEVFTFLDGKNFLERVRIINPDLILLDVRLPESDGRHLCRQVKENKAGVPVILMSAHADPEEIKSNGCAVDFIAKPFDIFDLVNRIDRAVA